MFLILSPQNKRIIERVINVFETGSPEGNYADISVFPDGPGDRRQITYGRSQTTEYGNLKTLIQRYYDAPDENTEISGHLAKFLPGIGVKSYVTNEEFKTYLRLAGQTDPVMRRVQDQFFDDVYFKRAMAWAEDNGFNLPLSALVIYDSFIHSGGILQTIRKQFPAVPPVKGGLEKLWIIQYVTARNTWLATHHRAILHKTTYRTRCLLQQIQRDNWNLDQLPIVANGVKVS